ncbi:LacI family DNA-binding transcriptional regulator [Ktedonosporobacter rubrisoli]|uniref:LacI family DNA-binding transcriptional regulator n=1 Tax=Ktedonosporobacter rubrisoli TaxID=2509675 RepID=UPI0013EEA332|nr:LacI family DNA-binding transcriptional regulator [Ktedonosporobacter rubrisoli]
MATIYDIAKAAGVTAATVSYVLSGKGSISQATREKVMRYASELGYRPNLIARSLIKQETHTIGLVIPHIINPFYAGIAETVERSAYARGFRTMITNTYEDERLGAELLEDLAARRVDGIIALPGGLSFSAIQSMIASGLPVICCLWEEEEGQEVSLAVGLDFKRGGQLVAEHLLGLGHRRISVIVDVKANGRIDHHLRFTGCQEALANAACPLDAALVSNGDSSLESGEAAAHQLLHLPNPPTAIFATNDLMAIGAMVAAWKLGMRVPADLSIIGFDNIALAPFTSPPLTTINVDRDRLVKLALDLLLSIIEGKQLEPPPLLAPELIARASTAICPASR